MFMTFRVCVVNCVNVTDVYTESSLTQSSHDISLRIWKCLALLQCDVLRYLVLQPTNQHYVLLYVQRHCHKNIKIALKYSTLYTHLYVIDLIEFKICLISNEIDKQILNAFLFSPNYHTYFIINNCTNVPDFLNKNELR